MAEQEKRTVEMAALKMPTAHMGFIRRNQQVAQKVGKLMVMLTDMAKSVQGLKEILGKPELFKQYIEDGTEEELAGFLKACLEISNNPEGVFHVKGISEKAFDAVVSKMGDHVVATKTSTEEAPKVELFQRKEHS